MNDPRDLLRWAIDRFGDRFAIVTAFQTSGMVLVDMAAEAGLRPRVVTVDTGRLPAETYALIDRTRARYDLPVEVLFPDSREVEPMVRAHGVDLFYRDRAFRELCCAVRKTFPLRRALEGLDAWASGLRRGQSDSRAETPKVQQDPSDPRLVKINPLADWSADDVWSYIRARDVPHNELYDRGYASIGCAPCTRAIQPGEPERAGRWWWEGDGDKECGIHRGAPSERLEAALGDLRGPS